MPVWRLQCAFAADTMLPRDQLVITPHFNDVGTGTDPDQLCQDLAEGLNAWDNATRQIRVTAYDAQGTVPVFPQGDHVVNPDAAPFTSTVREVAIVLSFYAQVNRPRHRGRLYIPAAVAGIGTANARPSLANRQKVADLVPIFTGLGGADVDWCVYSRVDDEARSVTNWWVDDAWDVQRSRGLDPTARLVGTTSEGGP
jgi:hypothetical protein